jgi:hypothetical protein
VPLDIPVNFAVHYNVFRDDVGAYATIRPHDQVVVHEGDVPFYLSIQIEIFTSGELTADDHGFSDVCHFTLKLF